MFSLNCEKKNVLSTLKNSIKNLSWNKLKIVKAKKIFENLKLYIKL